MSTDFSSLPVVDLAALRDCAQGEEAASVGEALHRAFSTTGFAYLINSPLTLSHDEIFGLARKLFSIPPEEKMRMAKKTFRQENPNTYRGYFPPQPGHQHNLKEGFEIGPASSPDGAGRPVSRGAGFDLGEPNVWPPASAFPEALRARLEALHAELQDLSARLLRLLAVALGGGEGSVAGWPDGSVSTLRLLHYPRPPPQPRPRRPTQPRQAHEASSSSSSSSSDGTAAAAAAAPPALCCAPHTDSGILTLLHQDPTGGLEVRSASGGWVPAPYVPGSIVVNVGDLMARASGGRYVATLHRVRACEPAGPGGPGGPGGGMGRLSVPFFFEPGERCLVRSVGGGGGDEGVLYGDHVRAKMSTWVEFQDVEVGAG